MTTIWNSRFCSLTVALVLTAMATPLAASDFFAEELGTDDAKIQAKVKNDLMSGDGGGADTGRGPVPYLKALGHPPQRVALISFYVRDSGNSSIHPYQGWSTHKNVTGEGIDVIANDLYAASIGALKEGFKASGIDLLTPQEFLDTPEKKQAYESFKLEVGWVGSIMKWGTHTDKDSSQLEGAPEGYRLFSLPTNKNTKDKDFGLAAQGGDGKMFQGLGHDLAASLGVDAVAVMYSIVQAEKKTETDMLGSYLYVFGPNPVKRDDNPSLYWTGHQYSGVQIKFRVTLIRQDKKDDTFDADFAGFASVAKALAEKTGSFLETKTRGAD